MKSGNWIALSLAVVAAFVAPVAALQFEAAAAQQRQRTPDSVVARQLAVRSIQAYYRGRSAFIGGTADASNPNSPYVPRVLRIMETLNRGLDSAAAIAPRDSIIASVRVWHRVVSGNFAAADSLAALACAAGLWSSDWCSAMRGFTKHNVGDFAAADSNFEAALRLMGEEQRCLWTDLSIVLNDFAHTEIMKKIPCGERGARNAIVWWLADPMWSVPGNERRTGHYARWTEATLADAELQFIGYRRLRVDRIGDDLEYFIRLGQLDFLNGYELGCTGRARFHCRFHNAIEMDRFMPWAASASAPFSTTIFDHSLAPRLGGLVARDGAEVPAGQLAPVNASQANAEGQRARFGSYGEVFVTSAGKVATIREAQTAVLLRSAGPVLFASFDPRLAGLYQHPSVRNGTALPEAWGGGGLAPDITASGFHQAIMGVAPMRATVAVSAGPHTVERVAQPTRVLIGEIARVSVAMDPNSDSALVSLEAFSIGVTEYNVSSRHRFAVWRPDFGSKGDVRSSDVILYAAPISSAQPVSANAVLPLMLPRTTVFAQEPLGLYWEVYGLKPGAEPEFELSVAAVDSGSALRAAGQSLGLVRRNTNSLVRWKSAPLTASNIGPDGEAPFNLQIALTNLAAGEHILTMTTRLQGDSVAAVTKVIQVRR